MVESKKKAYMSPSLQVVVLKQRYNLLGASDETFTPVNHGIGMAIPDNSEDNV